MNALPPPGTTPWVPPPPPPPAPAPGRSGWGWARPPVYAGFWSRFGATVIDWLIVSVAAAVVFVPGLILLINGDDERAQRLDGFGLTGLGITGLVLMFAACPVAVAVGVWMAWREGTTGQSPGKKALGIKVWRSDGSGPIGGGRGVGRRAFAYFISGQIAYLGYLWMLWDKPLRQTWHDKVVDSVVVEA